MKGLLLICFFSAIAFSCNTKKPVEEEYKSYIQKVEILNTDREFSAMSKSKGLREAFTSFMDTDAVLLRPNNLPLEGGQAMDLVISNNDSATSLTWEPKRADISKSGELAYTYGVYSRKPADEDTVYYGTYVTIWKKQVDGKWKFVLQSGNEGINPDEEEK